MPSAHRMGTQKTAVSHWRESTDPRCARIDWRRRTVSKEMGLSCLNSHEQEVFFFLFNREFCAYFSICNKQFDAVFQPPIFTGEVYKNCSVIMAFIKILKLFCSSYLWHFLSKPCTPRLLGETAYI